MLFSAGLAAVVLCVGPLASASACPGANNRPAELTIEQASASVHCLINKKRDRAGARKLRRDPLLATVAQQHSAEMDLRNFFSHYSPDGSSPPARINASGYMHGASSWASGEIIAWGAGRGGSPRAAVRQWMRSGTHRQQMLSRRFRHAGIGIAYGSPMGPYATDSAIYTVDFGFRK